ncbi:MAG: fibronectin type III domain-containing protein, partial [candidate division WOR-3 bacterium]|nr:fibronectin type III domain-containing protein [candidate division WOR-3 bacterium]
MSRVKYLLILGLIISLSSTAFAGVARYRVDYADTTYVPITGTPVPFTSFDTDRRPVPIGFTFIYDGVAYDTIVITTDGYGVLCLRSAGITSTLSNDPTSTTHKPVLAPLWDDLVVVDATRTTYITEGTPGNRVFTVQWRNVKHYSAAASDTFLNFQIKLFEDTPGKFMFVYGPMASSYTLSYGLGFNDPIGGTGHYFMQTVANSTTFSSTASNVSLSVLPTSNKRYLFTPPTPISTDITVTPGTGNYPNVKAAMDTLRNYGVSASINVFIAGTTTEPTATNTWDFIPGTHPSYGNYTVTLRLADGVSSATITGNVAGDAVQLRGMRNFIIDGDDPTTPGIQRGLTINNTNTGAAGRTLVLMEGCNGVQVKNCILTANAAGGAAATFGVVVFSTANISTSTSVLGVYGANNYNIIENNDIRDGATNRPTNCVIFVGSTTGGLYNIGNIVRGNLIRRFGGTGTSICGVRMESGDSASVITQNVVDMEASVTAATTVTGIWVSGTSVKYATITRNEIRDLGLTTATNPSIRGIRIEGATSATPYNLVANNMIYINPPASLGTGRGEGISIGAGLAKLYYNSVRIGGTQTSGAGNTFALRFTSTTARCTIFNNIWYNARTNSGGTGKHYACSTLTTTQYVRADNNVFYALSTGNMLSNFNNVDYTSLTAWRTATGQDMQSVSEDPPFVSATNLHLRTDVPTRLEKGARPLVEVTVDFDGEPRHTTFPDIGCDEGNFIYLDEVPPTITYTRLRNTTSTSAQTLIANIVDASGVETSLEGRPRLWYRTGPTRPLTGPFTEVIGVDIGGNNWQFTIPGQPNGTWVEYYVAAQDVATPPNVATNPLGTGYTYNPPNGTVASPNLYAVRDPLDFTIGASGADFTSITAALAVLSAGVDGSVQLLLNSDYTSTGEVFPIIFSAIPGIPEGKAVRPNTPAPDAIVANDKKEDVVLNIESLDHLLQDYEAKGFVIPGIGVDETKQIRTLTIKPNVGATPGAISGSHSLAIVFFNGSSYIIFDGVTITNTSNASTAANAAVVFANGATRNIVKNSHLRGGATSTGGAVVWFATTVTTSGNNGNVIDNCDIYDNGLVRPTNGVISNGTAGARNTADTVRFCRIYNYGPSGQSIGIFIANHTDDFVIHNNEIHLAGSLGAGTGTPTYGIAVGVSGAIINNTQILNNTIRNLNTTATASALYGIGVSGAITINNTLIENNKIRDIGATTSASSVFGILIGSTNNLRASRNEIYNLTSTATAPIIRGIYYSGGSGLTISQTVDNNIIYLDAITTKPDATIYGIDDWAFSGNTLKLYYNSIYIGGTGVVSGTTYGLAKRDVTTWDAKNNIVYNARSGGTGKHYAIYVSATTGYVANYNDFYVDGVSGVFGYWSTGDILNLLAWKAASNQDANSISANPNFVSATNLHINTNSLTVNRKATPITGITKDFDNEDRNPNWPDIGADEYTPDAPGTVVLTSPANNEPNVVLTPTLSWQPTPMAQYYDVYLEANNPNPTNIVSRLQTANSYMVPTPLQTGTDYYWKVVAWNDTSTGGKAQSSTSEIWKFTTVNPPNPPSNLTLGAITTTTMNLSWIDNAPSTSNPIAEDNFFVYRNAGSPPSVGSPYTHRIAILPPSPGSGEQVEYADNGPLTPNTRYYYRVTAYEDETGESFYTEANAWTLAEVPQQITFGTVDYTRIQIVTPAGNNPATTEILVRVQYGTNVKYVHPTTGALQDAEIWGTYSQFNNRFVIGLTPG